MPIKQCRPVPRSLHRQATSSFSLLCCLGRTKVARNVPPLESSVGPSADQTCNSPHPLPPQIHVCEEQSQQDAQCSGSQGKGTALTTWSLDVSKNRMGEPNVARLRCYRRWVVVGGRQYPPRTLCAEGTKEKGCAFVALWTCSLIRLGTPCVCGERRGPARQAVSALISSTIISVHVHS
ncbi:hypothetical protein HDK64DRAFT_83296 [Phyllosticta capitalensis]